MFRMGRNKNSPVFFRSQEKHPDGYSYYNRIYNGDGSHNDHSSSSSNGHNFPTNDERVFKSSDDQYQPTSSNHHDQHDQHDHFSSSNGHEIHDHNSFAPYPPHHIDSQARDQFMAHPDVNQYYDFGNKDTQDKEIFQTNHNEVYNPPREELKKTQPSRQPYVPTFGQPRQYDSRQYRENHDMDK